MELQVGNEVIYQNETWIVKSISNNGRMIEIYCPRTGETLSNVYVSDLSQ